MVSTREWTSPFISDDGEWASPRLLIPRHLAMDAASRDWRLGDVPALLALCQTYPGLRRIRLANEAYYFREPDATPNCTHRTVMLLPCGRMLPDRGRWREYGCRGWGCVVQAEGPLCGIRDYLSRGQGPLGP